MIARESANRERATNCAWASTVWDRVVWIMAHFLGRVCEPHHTPIRDHGLTPGRGDCVTGLF